MVFQLYWLYIPKEMSSSSKCIVFFYFILARTARYVVNVFICPFVDHTQNSHNISMYYFSNHIDSIHIKRWAVPQSALFLYFILARTARYGVNVFICPFVDHTQNSHNILMYYFSNHIDSIHIRRWAVLQSAFINPFFDRIQISPYYWLGGVKVPLLFIFYY